MANAISLSTSGSFTLRRDGLYTPTSATFGDASNELRIRPNTNQKQPSISVSRYKQLMSTNDPLTAQVLPITVTVNISCPKHTAVTPAILAGLVLDLSGALTAANINDIFNGSNEIATA